jgi:hypothetical protein
VSTYSTNLKIEEIGTGEQAGTWGTTTNANFENVFEQAIVGRVTVPFTNADVTLTATNSVASQSFRNVYLNCTGTNAASRNLIVPTINKNYVVQNNTTGGFDIVVKTTAGTGITVPNGFSCTVYADGTNVIQASNYFPVATIASGAFNGTIGATTPSTGVFTQVDITAQGDLRLQDTSGGQYVALQAPTTIATSYTLTMPVDDGTSGQALITDGSGNLSWSTAASGDVYGPASATDNAIARFDGTTGKIIQNSAVTIADTTGDITTAGYLITAAGAVGTPAITTTGDTNTGIFFPAADTIAFTEGGVESMRIDSAGNVGIGTTAPDTRLTVQGPTAQSSFTGSTYGAVVLRGAATTTNYTNLDFAGSSTFTIARIGTLFGASGSSLQFGTSNNYASGITNTAMTIDPSGNVGVGINNGGAYGKFGVGGSSYQALFALSSDASGAVGILAANSSSEVRMGSATNHPLALYTNGTEKARIDTSGNVGIGTSTPSTYGILATLGNINNSATALGTADAATVSILNNSIGGLGTRASISMNIASLGKSVISGYYAAFNGSNDIGTGLQFGTQTNAAGGTVERMRIDQNGNVMVGTTTARGKLHSSSSSFNPIAGNVWATTAAFTATGGFGGGIAIIDSGNIGYGMWVQDSGGTLAIGQGSGTGNLTERMRIDTAGNVGIGTSSPGARLHVLTSASEVSRFATTGADMYLRFVNSADSNGYIGYQSSAMTLWTANVERMRIDSSGNVGIGTSSPSTRLHVAGGDLRLNNDFAINWGGTGAAIIGSNNTLLRFDVNGSERMRINSSGQVLINGTSAFSDEKLFIVGNTLGGTAGNTALWQAMRGTDVTNTTTYSFLNYRFSNGSSHSTSEMRLQRTVDASTHGYLGLRDNASFTAGYNTTELMRLDSSGNVGIGTSSPLGKLKVVVGDVAPAASGNMNTGVIYESGSGARAINFGVNNTAGYSWINAAFANNSGVADNLVLMTGATERMRIDSVGRVLIGTTAQQGVNSQLTISSSSSTNSPTAAWIGTQYSSDVGNAALYVSKFDNNTTTSQIFVKFTVNNTVTASGQINANGASAAAFGSWSDKRLKENITQLPSQLANICALNPSEFDYKDGSGHQIGFIAQEIQEVYPDVVSEGEDGMLMVTGWSKTEARLVKAIQEQQTLINNLTTRLNALEGK